MQSDNSGHVYECRKCRTIFDAPDDYNDDPATRNCVACGDAQGEILYHGYKQRTFQIIRDDLGVQGILSHADGKHYDSKSSYYKSLKESGHIIHEAGMYDKPRQQRGDYNVSKELKEAAQRCGLIG